MTFLVAFLPLLAILTTVNAATKDDWRSRSVYQVITDRYAPQTEGAGCNTADRVSCGGTYNTLAAKLDYIQGMGYDAVWISPTGLNLEGNTIYGEAYHGYWTADPTQLNPHFGADADLKALSAALHSRGMYLMVDIAINGFASLSSDLSPASLASDDKGTLLFKQTDDYHPLCAVDFGNHTSEMDCWLATSGVALMDINQSNQNVSNTLINWVNGYVNEYSIDGFRLDASKHMPIDFQHTFCSTAGVFCIGEVAGDDATYAATFQGNNGIDSVFGFGLMYGFVACFTSNKTMATLEFYIQQAQGYPDPTLIGAFLDNQDLPRFNSLTNDKSKVYNAVVGTFLYGGIPTIYYGLEQDISDGSADPANREALWLYNDYSTTASPSYGRIATLNKIRSTLGEDSSFLNSVANVMAKQDNDIALRRGAALIVLTSRGSSGTGSWQITNSGFTASSTVVDLLSCSKSNVGSDASLTVNWTTGQPYVFVRSDVDAAYGFCGGPNSTNSTSSSILAITSASSTSNLTAASGTSGTPTSTVGGTLVATTTDSASLSASSALSSSVISSAISAASASAVVSADTAASNGQLTILTTTSTGPSGVPTMKVLSTTTALGGGSDNGGSYTAVTASVTSGMCKRRSRRGLASERARHMG